MKTRFTLHYVWATACFLLITTTGMAQPTFINKIPIPPLIDVADGVIELEARQFTTHKLNPGDTLSNSNIHTFCLGLGPLLEGYIGN